MQIGPKLSTVLHALHSQTQENYFLPKHLDCPNLPDSLMSQHFDGLR